MSGFCARHRFQALLPPFFSTSKCSESLMSRDAGSSDAALLRCSRSKRALAGREGK